MQKLFAKDARKIHGKGPGHYQGHNQGQGQNQSHGPNQSQGQFRKKIIFKKHGEEPRDLSSSKFRFLNELMYKQDSKELQQYFEARKDDFSDVG